MIGLRILQVIHGYPIRYNAGSENYTQTLARQLVLAGHEVQVFTREEDPFKPDFILTYDEDKFNLSAGETYTIPLHIINVARLKDRFCNEGVDNQFHKVLVEFQPHIVHFQHLNHLSTSLISIAKEYGSSVIYTLHDYWLACPRGQFLQVNYGEETPYILCDGQEDQKCAIHCYSRYFTGLHEIEHTDLKYWTNWIYTRMEHIRSQLPLIDIFIAPSPTIKMRMEKELSIPPEKILYCDYGFNLQHLSGRARIHEEKIVFGYIGTHTIAKGIDYLIKAFAQLTRPATLRIWGRERSEITPFLKILIKDLQLPSFLTIEWFPEYKNSDIVVDVFNRVDIIVVPSIWDENSPLVIHEALQCHVPVITANKGGMADFIKEDINGMLFEHRNKESLTDRMQYLLEHPEFIQTLGQRGYYQSKDGNVVSIEEHTLLLINIYKQLFERNQYAKY